MIRDYLPQIREHLPLTIVTILIGAFLIWILMEAPPFGIGHGVRVGNPPNPPGFDDSWECRHPLKGGPICFKKALPNVSAPQP